MFGVRRFLVCSSWWQEFNEKSRKINRLMMRRKIQDFCGELLQIVDLRRDLHSQPNGSKADSHFHVANNNRDNVQNQKNDNR